MTDPAHPLASQIAEIRGAFDKVFARPPAEPRRQGAEFLLVVAAHRPLALRLDDLAGVEVDRRIVAVPADAPGLLGLCGIRGHVVAVFHLGAILDPTAAKQPTRWLALPRGRRRIALALDGIEGIRRADVREIHPVQAGPDRPHLARQAIGVGSRLIHVLDVACVIASIHPTAPRR